MHRRSATVLFISRSVPRIPSRLGSNEPTSPRTKAYLLRGANFSQPSLYALSPKDTSILVDDDIIVTSRPSFERLKPWTARSRANAATLKTYLRKHEGASPEDLHRIHRSRGFLQSIQRSGTNWQAALATLQRMQAEPEGADVHAVGAAISVCAKAGRWQEAIAVLEGMEAHGLEPDAVVFTAAITACGRAKQWKQALNLFHTMEKRGLPLPTASFNAAISAAGGCGRWVEALGLLDLMDHYGAMPDVMTFGAAISACAKGGQWQKALALLDVAQGCGVAPNLVCINSAISACARGGEWQRALDLLASMPARGLKPDLYTLNGAIDACAKAGRADEAMQVLHNMQSKFGVAPNQMSYGAACNAFAKVGHWQKALQVLDDLEEAANAGQTKVPIDVPLVGAAINACANAASASSGRSQSERQAAAQAALKLVQSTESRFGLKPNAAIVGAAIEALDGGAKAAAVAGGVTSALEPRAIGTTAATAAVTLEPASGGAAVASFGAATAKASKTKPRAARKASARIPDLTAILAKSRALDQIEGNSPHGSNNRSKGNVTTASIIGNTGSFAGLSPSSSSSLYVRPPALNSCFDLSFDKTCDSATVSADNISEEFQDAITEHYTVPPWSEDDYTNAAADLVYEARTQWSLFPRAWPRRLAAVGHPQSRSEGVSRRTVGISTDISARNVSSVENSECVALASESADDHVEIDLHECSAALARSVLRCLLRDLEDVYAKHAPLHDSGVGVQRKKSMKSGTGSSRDLSASAGVLWPLVDIYVVTGRGKSLSKLPPQQQQHAQQQGNSQGKKEVRQSAVLPSAMRQFLKNVKGPRVSRVVSNTGCFVLTKADLEVWLKFKQEGKSCTRIER